MTDDEQLRKAKEVANAIDRLIGAAILRVVEMGLGPEIVILHEPDAQVVCVGPVPVYRVRVVLNMSTHDECSIDVVGAPVDGGPYLTLTPRPTVAKL